MTEMAQSAHKTHTEVATFENEAARRDRSLEYGYVPSEPLCYNPDLKLHTGGEPTVDPVTYEVIRNKFWNLNWDHQEVIRRASGSLVVVYGYDFNTTITTEDGEGVVFGPGNLFFAGCADLVVRWTLEHRSFSPGIKDGDVFIQDDPWVGTNHQMDTAVYAPVFVDGKLFSWVYNVVHQREIGGAEPGGFVQTAHDVYTEPVFWPPTKLVEEGTLRDDILDTWVRRSRLPSLMRLETKSQLAGINYAKARLLEMVERYGAETVKGVMRQMTENTARVTGERLAKLPDADWSDVRYVAGASAGDKKLYKFALTFEKRGDRIRVTNRGTDHSAGSFNITQGVMRSCVLNAVLPSLAYDQFLCGAGVLRQIDFDLDADSDLITSARHPAAISTSLGTTTSITQAHYLTSKMITSNPELASHGFGASALHTTIYNHTYGTDSAGKPYSHMPFDGLVGAIGAFSFRDGIDHGGGVLSNFNPVGSCEGYEREIPYLYLYRRELPTSGGHGQWRGGCTFVAGVTGHHTEFNHISSGGLFQSVTQGIAIAGAPPVTGGMMWHATDTKVRDEFAAGRIPADSEQVRALAPHGAPPPPKKFDNRLLPGDIFDTMSAAGAGYGDPILRDPYLVLADQREGRLLDGEASTIYGVIITAGEVDAEKTTHTRETMLRDRLATATKPERKREGKLADSAGNARIVATVLVGNHDGESVFACARCRHVLSGSDQSYRHGCAVTESPLEALGPLYSDPIEQTGVNLQARSYLCPSCGTSLDVAVVAPGDPIIDDVVLARP